MTSIVGISTVTTELATRPGEALTVVFEARCKSPRRVTLGARLVPTGATPSAWLKLEGGAGRQLAPGEVVQYRAVISPAADAVPGNYGFHLLAFDLSEPGERFDEGDTVIFAVVSKVLVAEASPPVPKLRRSWTVTLAWAAVALIIAPVFLFPQIVILDVLQGIMKVNVPWGPIVAAWLICTLITAATVRLHHPWLFCLFTFFAPILTLYLIFFRNGLIQMMVGGFLVLYGIQTWKVIQQRSR